MFQAQRVHNVRRGCARPYRRLDVQEDGRMDRMDRPWWAAPGRCGILAEGKAWGEVVPVCTDALAVLDTENAGHVSC